MNKPVKILVDWGGTIIRDKDLFKNIAEKSGNTKTKWESPNSWNKIRHIGDKNYFEDIKDSFFMMGEEYQDAVNSVSFFCGEDLNKSESFVYIVFDNKPEVFQSQDESLKKLAFAWNNRKGTANGLYVERNKIILAKQIQSDIIVDDDPRIAIAAAVSGVKVILMLREWNRHFRSEDLIYYVKEEGLEKAKSNIMFAEDWFDASIKITSLIDGHIV